MFKKLTFAIVLASLLVLPVHVAGAAGCCSSAACCASGGGCCTK